jgi:Radical SAM superfamily
VAKTLFHFVMIKPTHYDDDGYPIQWLRSAIPSNTLGCLNGLAVECNANQVLGDDVELVLDTYDETNRRVRPDKIIRKIQKDGGKALIGLVGVQSNQFPRALDIARPFLKAGIQVCIGGFHVSGCLAMLKDLTPELRQAQEMGISFFAGEAEDGRLGQVLRDAYAGKLEPIYNFMNDLPNLEGECTPILPSKHIRRTAGGVTGLDCGRGCPFQCSFCTIINVQGRISRYRSPDDIEKIIRANLAQGINRFFMSDDNFARNRNWEPIFDRLIELREAGDIEVKFLIEVDTLCHRIPDFIEKAAKAGVTRVFIGLENINPDNLAAVQKKQNRITEYREMLQEWKSYGITTYAGYILGFPNDTRESMLRDIEILQRELPLDLLEFNILTPLPGSQDHKTAYEKGVWMDPDMNKYDLNHRVTHHETMSDDEFDRTYRDIWTAYYSPEHMERIMRRAAATGINAGNILFLMLWFYLLFKIENVHPLEGGYMRMKFRKDRRPDLPRENPLVFYPKYAASIVSKHAQFAYWIVKMGIIRKRIKRDPEAANYMDVSLTPPSKDEVDELSMFTQTRGGKSAVAKMRHDKAIINRVRKVAAE